MKHTSFASTSLLLSNNIDVLIVGAGPCGLAVAKALQNRNIYPEIIEKNDEIRSDGAGIAIPANGSWALDKLGIDITLKALTIKEMQFTDDQAKLLAKEEVISIHPEGSQFYSLCRKELIEELLNHLDKSIKIDTGLTIKHFSEENDKVKIEFSNGSIKFYDFVIGCDGIYSSLRSQVHPNEIPEFLELFVWRTVIPQYVTIPTYMLGPDRLLLIYPMPQNNTYVYGHIYQTEKRNLTESFEDIFSSFSIFKENSWSNLNLSEFKFHKHHMEKSHSVRFKLDGYKRILLLGDAAHAFGPMLQNGAAQAFEDAYVLQELFNARITNKSIPELINAFEARRFDRVQKIFTMSNAKIKAISDPKQINERNEAIKQLGPPNVNAFKMIMKSNP